MARTIKQKLHTDAELLGQAEAWLLRINHLSRVAEQSRRAALREIHAVRVDLEAIVNGPVITRARRIAAECAMTGDEQELPL
jgi:hypothetical protein